MSGNGTEAKVCLILSKRSRVRKYIGLRLRFVGKTCECQAKVGLVLPFLHNGKSSMQEQKINDAYISFSGFKG